MLREEVERLQTVGRRATSTLRRAFRPWRRLLLVVGILGSGVGAATHAWQEARLEAAAAEPLPTAEFARLVREFSEDDGFFRSDNFVSNETSYLHVVDKLRELEATGGAYLGVGPEQNFTYIARIRPRIAFIVDIRRQAVIQHLMFKALFSLSDNRTEFLSRLLAKPLAGANAPGSGAAIQEILKYLAETPSTEEDFTSNLGAVGRVIQEEFQVPLGAHDQASLEYVCRAFRDDSLNIQYRTGGSNWGSPQWARFPTLRDLILEPDLRGRLGNFLVTESDYRFVRDLHRANRIIPIVGDFGGPKALSRIGEYLSKNGYTVTAFYTSNVEQYLFTNGSFGAFAENVRRLPIGERSLFIRAFPNMRDQHPAQVQGHRLTTLLQKIGVFLADFDQGLYENYWRLVTTHFITGDQP